DDEGHDAGIAVVGGIGDERKAADHLAFDHVVERPARGARALPGQDPIVIAVIGLRLAAGLVAFRGRVGGKLPERTVVVVRRPIEAVLFAGTGDDPLRIDAHTVAAILIGIFVLCVDKSEAGLDRVELIAPDAAVEDFPPTLVGI